MYFLKYFFLIPLLSTLLISGCAGSKAYSRAISPLAEGVTLSKYKNLEVNVNSRRNIVLESCAKERIATLIKSKIVERDPNLFNDISNECSEASTLVLNILITKYEKGSAFARSMAAGYGQIHINAVVTLEDKQNNSLLAKYAVKKTFAWGGLYGGMTSIEAVEYGFAEAIVDIVMNE